MGYSGIYLVVSTVFTYCYCILTVTCRIQGTAGNGWLHHKLSVMTTMANDKLLRDNHVCMYVCLTSLLFSLGQHQPDQ